MKLSPEAQVLAAKMFTTSNLGQDRKGDEDNANAVEKAFDRCVSNHAFEGIDINEEYFSWLKKLRRNSKWEVGEALKRMPWLAAIGTVGEVQHDSAKAKRS